VPASPVRLYKEVSFTYPQVAVFARQVIYLFEHNDLSGQELLYTEGVSPRDLLP